LHSRIFNHILALFKEEKKKTCSNTRYDVARRCELSTPQQNRDGIKILCMLRFSLHTQSLPNSRSRRYARQPQILSLSGSTLVLCERTCSLVACSLFYCYTVSKCIHSLPSSGKYHRTFSIEMRCTFHCLEVPTDVFSCFVPPFNHLLPFANSSVHAIRHICLSNSIDTLQCRSSACGSLMLRDEIYAESTL